VRSDYYTISAAEMLNPRKKRAAIDNANSQDITFCSDLNSTTFISKSNTAIILCDKKLGAKVNLKSPKLAFTHIAKNLFEFRDEFKSPNTLSKISKTAIVGRNSIIGDFTIVGDNSTIGDNSVIFDKTIF
jgi:UDP-3-O-[3-hydroxymyristoyl] glucosamine N-acyltransferase